MNLKRRDGLFRFNETKKTVPLFHVRREDVLTARDSGLGVSGRAPKTHLFKPMTIIAASGILSPERAITIFIYAGIDTNGS